MGNSEWRNATENLPGKGLMVEEDTEDTKGREPARETASPVLRPTKTPVNEVIVIKLATHDPVMAAWAS